MGHPSIENRTPFVFEQLALADEEMRPLLVLVVKGTYAIGSQGLRLAEEQVPLCLAGESWGEPEKSSYRYEPECAFIKLATDVVLVGHAYAPDKDTREMSVSLRVGSVQKTVRVLGERVWFKSMGTVMMTKPLPFERLPLVYERAFGGWDRSAPDTKAHTFEPRNPVGVGFRASARNFEEGLRLPNLEDPAHPLKHFGQVVPPAGFGFISPHWQPRAALAGTYDETWSQQRSPLLPRDFDRRFFNAASPGLVASGYLRGAEPVLLTHGSRHGRLAFNLPAQPPPKVMVRLAASEDAHPPMHLDTCIIDIDAELLFLIWRGHVALRSGPDDVWAIEVKTGER